MFVSVIYALLLAIGVVTIRDTAMPVPLPVDGAIALVVDSTPNNKIYQKLKNITDETFLEMVLRKKVIDNNFNFDGLTSEERILKSIEIGTGVETRL